jgi:hypothetical protein
VSPVKYELGFYNPVDAILHSHCRENLKSYTVIEMFMTFRISVLIQNSVYSVDSLNKKEGNPVSWMRAKFK